MAPKLLIFGGQQYLPFARSRLTAMRAAQGSKPREQQHAVERYLLPDAKVTIRISGEHEYIRLEGGSTDLSMDSGLIDLQSVSASAELRYASGIRAETDSTQAYLLPFTLGATAKKWAAWRSNPEQIPHGQMIGTVEVPQFAGHIRGDLTAAPSFEAAREPVTPATTPPTWQFKADDDLLYAKKAMVSSCPASIFTGRCRLYLQSMYGRPLYAYGSDTSVEPKTGGTPRPSLASASPPSLTLPAFKRADDEVVYPDITIGTSTGVRLDTATGKHWLMVIGGAHVTVYPLLSSKVGESLRKYLVAPTVGAETLSAGDVDKLEAFILAYCLPDVKNAISVPLGETVANYSMGYGWHWNWSGTLADLVDNSTYDQGGGFTGMESTHYRITVSKTDADWSAVHTTVEGPKRWAVNRLYWCIAEPEWGNMATLKSTPKLSTLIECDAPFYAFYTRDDLQVCRIQVESVAPLPNRRSVSLNFATGDYGDPVAMFTCGYLGGYCYDTAAGGAYYAATISCGSWQVADLALGKTDSILAWEVYDKSLIGSPSRIEDNDQSVAPGVSFTRESGYFPPYGTPDISSFTGPGISSVSSEPLIQFTRETSSIASDESSTITVVVPFHDAEAIFCDTASFVTETKTGRQRSVRRSTGFSTGWLWIPEGGTAVLYESFTVAGTAGDIVSTDAPDTTVETTTDHRQKLVCHSAPLDATMGELASFHDGEDYAQVTYSVLSGTSDVSPVVISPGNAVPPVGIPGTTPQFPALVGWV